MAKELSVGISAVADDLKASFAAFVDALASGNGVVTNNVTHVSVKKGKSKPAEADVDEDTGRVVLDRDEVESLSVVDLRKLAKENGIDLKKKAEILSAFEEKGFFADSDQEDDEDEDEVEVEDDEEADDDEEDADEDEESAYTREDLEEKTLRDLKKIAKEEGHTQEEIKGLDQDELIDLILGEEDEDEDDEDDEDEADEDSDDESEEDDDEEVEIDKKTLEAMSDAELKNIVKEFGIKLPKKANRKTIIQTILDAAEEDGDEDDD